jgi:hypothetical protein
VGESEQELDWRKLPTELRYVVVAAELYGDWRGDPEFYAAADSLTSGELSALSDLAARARIGGHSDLLRSWLGEYPIDRHPESSRVYHLMLLLDYLDLPYE